MKKNKCIKIFLCCLVSLMILYILFCLSLFLFEPVYYSAPDLRLADYSFNLYNKFSYAKNSDFYIDQISSSDISVAEDDIRLKYVDDTILVIFNDDISFDDAATLFAQYDAEITGFIDILDFYQIAVSTDNYEQLVNICSDIENNKLVKSAIIDYFEETPVAEASTDNPEIFNYYNPKYYEILGLDKIEELIDLNDIAPEVTVGVFDILVNYDNSQLNVTNMNDYKTNALASPLLTSGASHGTHVSGIMTAKDDVVNNVRGVVPGASVYSDNATNNSISYWIAALTNMIVNQDIKAINISMGYNSYIPISASLGDENSLYFIEDENQFFECVFLKILDEGYEFLLCIAAGNEANTSLYKVNSPYFGYGEKKLFEKVDIFGLFDAKPDYCNSAYSLCFNMIENSKIKDRIMIVTACDIEKRISSYASSSSRIDIVAPGDEVCSTSYPDKYETMSGTSMATPFVTGTAALLFELDPSLTGKQVKEILINTSDEDLSDSFFSYPLLNIYNAVDYVVN